MDRQQSTIGSTAFKVFASLLLALPATGTTVFRVDPPPVMVTAGTVPPGGLPALYAVAGATVSIYTDAAGTLPATTYTDTTGNTSCPTTAQIVQAGTAVCSATTGNQGQFGFWLAAGTTYYYRITLPSGATVGPLPLTSATTGVTGITAGTGISVNASTGNVTVTNAGVTQATAGTGIGVSAGTGNVTFSNSGVTSLAAGTGIGVSASTGAVTVSNNGVTSFNSRTGAVSPATNDYTYSQIGGTKQGNTNVPQMAGTNSNVSGALLCNDASGNATTSGCSSGSTLPSASNQVTYLRVKPNSSNLTTDEWAALPVVYAKDYNFASQSPGGTLVGTTPATVTLTPCPLGVAGTHTSGAGLPQQLYIAGTGTAESVAITGGSCVGDGVNSGTIQFTPANNHSAGWTIQSSSAGASEASYTIGATARIWLPCGTVNVYGTMYFAYPTWLSGCGKYGNGTILSVGSNWAGELVDFLDPNVSKATDFEEIYTTGSTPSSGAGIHFAGARLTVDNVIITGNTTGPYIGIFCEHVTLCGVNNSEVYGPVLYGVSVDNTLNSFASSFAINRTAVICTPNNCTAGFFFRDSIQSGTLTNSSTEVGQNGMLALSDQATSGISDNFFTNNIFDNPSTNGIYFHCTFNANTCGFDQNFVSGNAVFAKPSTLAVGMTIDPGSGGLAENFTISGNLFSYASSQIGINALGLVSSLISGNRIFTADNTAGTGIAFQTRASSDVQVIGNTINAAQTSTCPVQAVFLDSQSHTDIFIDGNTLCGTSASVTSNNTSGGGTVTPANYQLTVPTVASATAQAIPVLPFFYLSGTGAPTSVTNLASSRPKTFTFIATNAAPGAWTAGATIGNSFTPSQNVPVNCLWDGTKVYCK